MLYKKNENKHKIFHWGNIFPDEPRRNWKPFRKITSVLQTPFFLVVPKIVGFPPKSCILIGFSIINHPFWGTPIFGNTYLNELHLRTAKKMLGHHRMGLKIRSLKNGVFFGRLFVGWKITPGSSPSYSAKRPLKLKFQKVIFSYEKMEFFQKFSRFGSLAEWANFLGVIFVTGPILFHSIPGGPGSPHLAPLENPCHVKKICVGIWGFGACGIQHDGRHNDKADRIPIFRTNHSFSWKIEWAIVILCHFISLVLFPARFHRPRHFKQEIGRN